MQTEDIYISAMRYGCDNLNTGVTIDEVREHLKAKGFVFDSVEEGQRFSYIFNNVYSGPTGKGFRSEQKCYITIESYFKLLEYEELSHARESSKSAARHATLAIWIASLSFICSFITSLINIFSS